MHEGRVFPIGASKSTVVLQPRIQYRWLCRTCCRSMTITENGRVEHLRQAGFRIA